MNSVRDGSSLHYSLIWTPEVKRRSVIDQLILNDTLANILAGVTDPGVANQKLAWWEEELSRFAASTPRHPVLQSCANNLRTTQSPNTKDSDTSTLIANQLINLLNCHKRRWMDPPENQKAMDLLVTEECRSRLALVSYWLTQNVSDLDPQNHPDTAADALGRYEYCLKLRHRLLQGDPIFSQDCYTHYALEPQDLLDAANGTVDSRSTVQYAKSDLAAHQHADKILRVKAMMQKKIDTTHQMLHKATNDLNVKARYEHKPLHPIWILLVLRRKQLDLWSSTHPNLLKEHSTLTPIRKLTIAWWNYLLLS